MATFSIVHRPAPADAVPMIVLRIVGFVVLLVIAASGVVYLLTGDRRWIRFAGQVLRFAVIVAAVFMALYLFERVVMFI